MSSIKDSVMFGAKEEMPLLQLADACSWTFNRHAAKGSYAKQLIRAMLGDSHSIGKISLSSPGGRGAFLWRAIPTGVPQLN